MDDDDVSAAIANLLRSTGSYTGWRRKKPNVFTLHEYYFLNLGFIRADPGKFVFIN